MKMIHWDTLQGNEKRCRSDNHGSAMSRHDEAVYLHLRSDLVAAPDMLAVLEELIEDIEAAYPPATSAEPDFPDDWPDLYATYRKAKALIDRVEGES